MQAGQKDGRGKKTSVESVERKKKEEGRMTIKKN